MFNQLVKHSLRLGETENLTHGEVQDRETSHIRGLDFNRSMARFARLENDWNLTKVGGVVQDKNVFHP
jgi:hypothetical protein